METFSQLSPSFVRGVRPYDPEADRTFGEELSRIGSGLVSLPSDVMSADSGWRRAAAAAEEQARAVDLVTSSNAIREDWFSNAIDRVKKVSGVDLTRPSLAITMDQSDLDYGHAFEKGTQTQDDLEAEFFRKARELATRYPELSDITADRLQGDLVGRAQAAEKTQQSVWQDPSINPWIKGAGSFWGGFKGAVAAGDPATLVSVFMPAGGKGATFVERLWSSFLTQATVGGVTTAASQPTVQDWRQEVGLPSGFKEAAANTAFGALVGGVGGATVHAGGEAIGAGWRAARDLAARGVNVTPDMERALQWAGEIDAANETMRAARPETTPGHAGETMLMDGLTTAEEPSAPLPLVDPSVPPGVTDSLAREALAGVPSIGEAIGRISETAEVLQSALASPDPNIRDVGRIATLDPAIKKRVVEGSLSPAHAAAVAATTDDPALQASAIAAIDAGNPKTVAEARKIASDAVSAERSHASAAAMQGADFGPLIEATPETFAAAFEEGRRRGAGEIVGALSHPDLGAIDAPIGNKRFGLLHIEGKHPEVSIGRLPEIIARSKIVERTPRKAVLFDGETESVIRLRWEDGYGGPSIDKRWLVTAYEKNGRPEAVTSRAPDEAATGSFAAPADGNIRPASSDIKDAVPMLRDDGTVEIVSRSDLDQVAAREEWMGDVINACKS